MGRQPKNDTMLLFALFLLRGYCDGDTQDTDGYTSRAYARKNLNLLEWLIESRSCIFDLSRIEASYLGQI